MLRIFGRNNFYLKSADTIENMAKINTIIFDKTGTITSNDKSTLIYKGEGLSTNELIAIKSVLRASNHPLSRLLYDFIESESLSDNVFKFEEIIGKGIQARIHDMDIQLGSASFVGAIISN